MPQVPSQKLGKKGPDILTHSQLIGMMYVTGVFPVQVVGLKSQLTKFNVSFSLVRKLIDSIRIS